MGYNRVVAHYGLAGGVGCGGVGVPPPVPTLDGRRAHQVVPLVAGILGVGGLLVPVGDPVVDTLGLWAGWV